jgi:flagellar motor switch protein FliG
VGSFKGGVKEAAKMLAALAPAAQKSLLEEIKKKDPAMAAKLEDNLISMEDLQYLTPSMLVGLLRDIDLEKFGLSLRTIDQSIADKLLAMVSTGIRLDIEDGLKGKPRKVSEVEEAQREVLDLLRKKVDLGHIVINPDGGELV